MSSKEEAELPITAAAAAAKIKKARRKKSSVWVRLLFQMRHDRGAYNILRKRNYRWWKEIMWDSQESLPVTLTSCCQ